MDYQFPNQLFPSFYYCGPPDSLQQHCVGNWGCYDRVMAQGGSGPLSSWTYTSRHRVRGVTWHHREPVPLPLLSPRKSVLWPVEPPDPLDFREHLQNFFIDHRQDAFGCMGEILHENLDVKGESEAKHRKNLVYSWKTIEFGHHNINPKTYSCRTLDGYSSLLWDVVHSVSPELLGGLLYRELKEQRDRLLFSEEATGGALAFIPCSQSSERGCLVYPQNPGLDCLNFHQVDFQHQSGGSPCVDAQSSSSRFQLKGPVRQISSASLLNQSCVAVRSDYLCGVWGFSETNEPHLHQVINTRDITTCISVSPHVLGEVLVASESGTANLWTVGRGTQKVREEDSNLYFNAKSLWRWCEFSAHPRVMLYADRTGAEFTDIRVSPAICHTLFRISKSSECRNGERLILSKYLSETHPFHHLVTTQYSAYIMDERFPGVPMLKWDHMAQSPPMFCHVISGTPTSSGSSAGGAGTVKVLLGSQSSQEITLLQYTGGRTDACSSHGPPQALLRTKDSLKHLLVQIPHHLETATNRLSSPAAGLTCIQMKGKRGGGGEESLCVLQLTEAGDIFYQIIESEKPDMSAPPAAEEESPKQSLKEAKQPDSQLVVSETSSDEDVFAPSQAPTVQRFVPEPAVRVQRGAGIYTDTSSEDSQSEAWERRKLKRLNLPVIPNDDPEPDTMNGLDKGDNDGPLGEITDDEPGNVEETVGSRSPGHVAQTEVQLSDSARGIWKLWLKKLIKKSCKKAPQPDHFKHIEVQTDNVFPRANYPDTDSGFQKLRHDLRACMSKHSLLVHASVSDFITAPDVEPIPNPVVTDEWEDQLSQRLTLSWQGEGTLRAWWENSLGLNREQKMAALRRKRRKEKEARRASGRRPELSESFTSSISYQSELSDFSDYHGWSSATSQELCSDAESVGPQSVGFTDSQTLTASTPPGTPSVQTDSPATATTQSARANPEEQQTASSSCTSPPALRPISTWSSLRINKRPAVDVLSSLDEPSQQDSNPSDSTVWPGSPPVAASSQPRSSLSLSLRSLGKDLSQDSLVWSVSQRSFQNSQVRPGLFKSSQPKKKSRMGF
ncbi:TATA box-binding protein-associated factor RNA polymerase I subunit C [Halichoeres trimaculatus]|uniref:TATA box-binding protein-associated factor RNA polymerase I subunit C n=1 Tax=Halichoeres trimaculatus TaxID=147232 RepID=UPI003D9DD7E4